MTREMKTLLIAVMMFIASAGSVMAQNVNEPGYIGQVAHVKEDGKQLLLTKEEAQMKTKTSGFGYIPIPGSSLLDKGKTFLQVKGSSSPTKIGKGKNTFIIRVKDNNEDPKNALGVFKFEAKKKERRFMMAEVGVLSGVKATTSFNTVPYEVKKYGESSYMVTIHDLAPGEYGIVTSDIGNVSTFSVE